MERKESAVVVNLPKFTEVIQIEVSVDSIYQKLLNEFPEEYKHREMLSHAIIGSAFQEGNLSYIYNALNGYTQEINFSVGEIIMCESRERNERYDALQEDRDGNILENAPNKDIEGYSPKYGDRNVAIGECKILEINLYRREKLKVQYTHVGKYDGKETITTAWVNHLKCSNLRLMEMAH